MNPYKVLGVSETATQEEIRAAYLALVKKYHPDRYADGPLKEMAGEKLKEINRAYELIGKHGGERGGAERTASYGPERTARSAPYAGPNAAAFARVRSLISHNSLGAARRNSRQRPPAQCGVALSVRDHLSQAGLV